MEPAGEGYAARSYKTQSKTPSSQSLVQKGGPEILQLATHIKFAFHFVDSRVPAAPAGQVDLPAGGAVRAPPAPRLICPAGAAGTPKIGENKTTLKICNKVENGRSAFLQ